MTVEYWQKLSDNWKQILALNYLFEFRLGLKKKKNMLTIGVSPYSCYESSFGVPFKLQEQNADELREMSKMTHLYCGDMHFDDLSPIALLPELQFLDISFCSITQKEFLNNCTKLTELFAENALGISSIDFSTFQNLKKLNIRDVGFSNLEILVKNNKLQFLDIAQNALTELNGIERIGKLEILYCDGCPIENGSALTKCKKIQVLDISNTFIKSLDFLNELPNLKSVNYSNTPGASLFDKTSLLSRGVEIIEN